MAKQVTLTDRQTHEVIYPVTSTDSVYNKDNKSVDELFSETYDKIDNTVVAVYKYKGSVATTANLPLSGNTQGDVYNVESDGSNYAWKNSSSTGILSDWDALGGTVALATGSNNGLMSSSDFTKLSGIASGAQVNTVTSVAGKVGVVTLVKADVGLSNVDNTTDANKPISTATQTALNLKVDKVTGKALSTNDYTDADKTKLAGLSNYSHPTYTDHTSGLYKIAVTNLGHVSDATSVIKSDITDLGIPAQDTTYTNGTGLTLSGTTINHTDSITAGTTSSSSGSSSFGSAINIPYVTYNNTGHITAVGTNSVTLPSNVATTLVDGLMSTTDKTKLDGIDLTNYFTKTQTNAELSYKPEINVDVLVPLSSGYYTISTAIAAIGVAYRKINSKITFATAAGIQETYQFKSTTVDEWTTVSNWEFLYATGRYGNINIVDNVNTLTMSGPYTAYGAATGVPNNLSSWFIQHINSSAGILYAHQRAIAYNATLTVYERTKINSVWGSWIQIGTLATTSLDGLMSATDKTRIEFNYGSNAVTTLAPLPVTKNLITASLSTATTLSVAAGLEVNQSIHVCATASAAFTQTIPNNSTYVAMNGTSFSITSGMHFEIDIKCVSAGVYWILVSTQS